MDKENEIRLPVEHAVARYVHNYLQATPKSLSIDIHSADVIVTLQGIVPPVEKDFAQSHPDRRALLERCYSDAFDMTKAEVEKILENILGRDIQSSMLRIDPGSGNAVMVFNLANESKRQQQ